MLCPFLIHIHLYIYIYMHCIHSLSYHRHRVVANVLSLTACRQQLVAHVIHVAASSVGRHKMQQVRSTGGAKLGATYS